MGLLVLNLYTDWELPVIVVLIQICSFEHLQYLYPLNNFTMSPGTPDSQYLYDSFTFLPSKIFVF